MKKNVIALLLSTVMAFGSISGATVFAAETEVQEAIETQIDEERQNTDQPEDETQTETTVTEPVEDSEEVNSNEVDELGAGSEDGETEYAEEAENDAETDSTAAGAAVIEEEQIPEENTEISDNTSEEENTTEENTAESLDDVLDELTEEIEAESISNESKDTVVQSGSCGENVTWTWDNDGILTISGKGPMTDYDGYGDLPWHTFPIKTIIIKSGVTSIGDYAFYISDEATKVTIPDTVTSIGRLSFGACKKLTSITLPDHITSIGSYAFEDCWALTKVTMPNDLTNLGEHAFSGCTELSGISIPSGVKTIQSRTFWMCYGLKSVTLKGVTEIGFDGFAFCKSLTSISLPKTLTTIGMGAFFSCGSLENIALPDAVTSIGDDAFENCKSLKSIVFPMNLESLASNAFVGCNSLTTVTMHKNVKNIGSDAFDNCSQLATVFYLGTQDEWLSIDIGTPNNELLGANIIFVGDPYDMKFAQVTGISNATYTGKPITPSPVVKQLGVTLKKGTDYKVAYSNNTKIGTAKVTITGIGKYTGTYTKTFRIVLGKTERADLFNNGHDVKITWHKVPGAKYYKVYRNDLKEPVCVTSLLYGYDKDPKLKNGQKYTYKIVASLTGKDNSGGDSPLSYSKVMYRLTTVVIRSAKNLEPGKVKVTYDKTPVGDSYVLQWADNEKMVGATTKVVKPAGVTSCVITGLTKGKTYYVSSRVRKTVGGVNYYTTFGVPKKVRIDK